MRCLLYFHHPLKVLERQTQSLENHFSNFQKIKNFLRTYRSAKRSCKVGIASSSFGFQKICKSWKWGIIFFHAAVILYLAQRIRKLRMLWQQNPDPDWPQVHQQNFIRLAWVWHVWRQKFSESYFHICQNFYLAITISWVIITWHPSNFWLTSTGPSVSPPIMQGWITCF